ncbi:hypothetical protein Pelo_16710 [Pelomyxa schiedti]|nr:hypothetical protein Pelo_16710 [Pelomyxa schiedti]
MAPVPFFFGGSLHIPRGLELVLTSRLPHSNIMRPIHAATLWDFYGPSRNALYLYPQAPGLTNQAPLTNQIAHSLPLHYTLNLTLLGIIMPFM